MEGEENPSETIHTQYDYIAGIYYPTNIMHPIHISTINGSTNNRVLNRDSNGQGSKEKE